MAGLITVERRGKSMLCGVNRDVVEAVAEYLGDAILTGSDVTC